ncbi:hypothetical protein A2317_02210 [Candidatus Uhrbacteria bacterium RIFOXYB2_FULL_41_10]|nr:MAG: hypothetical protein A2317_02210 [Candidatus Uhrbacteria bacterium RIFOXYB2_FULL_41_10]
MSKQEKILPYILPVIFFLLPWQTLYIFSQYTIAGEVFQYGVVSLYAVELLVVFAYLLYGRLQITKSLQKIVSLTFLLMGFVLASALWAINFDLALGQFAHILVALMLFLLLLDKRTNLQHVAMGLIAGLIIPIGLSVWQVVVGASGASTLFGLAFRDAQTLGDAVLTLENGTRILRAYGSFSHPNIFGGYLVIGLLSLLFVRLGLSPFSKGEWEGVAGRVQKILWLTTFVFLFIGLILTYSQSAWIAIIIAFVCGIGTLFFWRQKIANPLWQSRIRPCRVSIKEVWGSCLLARFKVIALIFSVLIILGSIFGILTLNSIGVSQTSITERAAQYQEWPQVVSDFWIFGSGLGNYTYAVEAFDPSKEWWQYQPVHNAPMLIVGEIGVVGLILVIGWLALIDKLNVNRILADSLSANEEQNAVCRFGSIIALMMGCALLVIAGLDHYLWSQWSGLALVAYVVAMTARVE